MVNTTLDYVHLHTPDELWTWTDNKVTVDLPLVARLVGCGEGSKNLEIKELLRALLPTLMQEPDVSGSCDYIF